MQYNWVNSLASDVDEAKTFVHPCSMVQKYGFGHSFARSLEQYGCVVDRVAIIKIGFGLIY